MEQNSQMRTITSQREGWPLSFQCPQDWEVRPLTVQSGVRFFLRAPLPAGSPFFPSISVEARPGPNRTLDGLPREWIARRGAFRTFRLLSHTETSLTAKEAKQLDAAYEMPASLDDPRSEMITIREQVIFALWDERIYELTYRATQADFDAHLPIFQALVASFRLETAALT